MTVYVLRAKESGWYKVGYTSLDVRKRLGELQTGCPLELEIYAIIHGAGRDVEREIQSSFTKHLSGGGNEWYSISEETLGRCLWPYIDLDERTDEQGPLGNNIKIDEWVYRVVDGGIDEIEEEIERCITEFGNLSKRPFVMMSLRIFHLSKLLDIKRCEAIYNETVRAERNMQRLQSVKKRVNDYIREVNRQ